MKKILSGIAFALVASCLASSTAMATATCTDIGTINTNVLTVSAAGGCTLGGLTFSNFSVNGTPAPPGTTVFLSSVGTGTSAGEVDLGFQIVTAWNGTTVTAADTILMYTVSGPGDIVGVDNSQSGGAGVVIQEIVCDVAFGTLGAAAGKCPTGHELTNFSNPPNNSGTFAAQSTIYILKDISQNGSNASISGFVNSHETAGVPEPASLSMMGLGLLGLGLIGRRRRKV